MTAEAVAKAPSVSLLKAWVNFSKANVYLQQFGQANDRSTWNGSTGCTHAMLQRLVKAKTGTYYSQDAISNVARYPWPENNRRMRGLMTGGPGGGEVGRVMRHYGLPYVLKMDLSWAAIMSATKRGPVLLGIRYGYWPEDVGYRYFSRKADGKPGGFAFRNGKTQLVGAERIYHAILILGQEFVAGGYRTYANEPNHGTGTRPERPDYDSVRSVHASRAYNQYASDGRPLFAWVPTRTFRPKGY